MRKQPKISIIVPVKSMAGKLSNFYTWTIELNSDYELIVVHDLGDLETTKELVGHLEKYVICKYLYLEGVYGSPGAARNAGLKLATGEWVMFWDSDDVGQVAEINEWLRKEINKEVDFEVFRFVKSNALDASDLVQKDWSNDFNQNFLNWLLEPGIWRCLFRRSRIKGLVFTEILMGEDQIFILDVLAKGIIPRFSNLISYKYYLGISGQLTSSKKATKDIDQATRSILERRILKSEIVTDAIDILWTKMSLSGLKKLNFNYKVKIAMQLVYFGLRYSQVRITLFEVVRSKSRERKKNSEKKVVVSIAGGLGNQLFQIAAGLAISEGNGIELETGVAHPRRNNRGDAEIQSFHLPENIKVRKLKYPNWLMRKNINLFLRFGASSKNFHKVPGYKVIVWMSSAINTVFFKEWRQTVAAIALGDSPIEVPRGKIYLVGLFQTKRWPESKDVYSVMTNFEVLNPSDELASLKEAAFEEEPLVVHVRLGDYLAEDSFGIPSKAYYENAVKLALEKRSYKSVWLFSNDLESARGFLPKNLTIPVREIGDIGDSSAQVLQAMRLGWGYVIGNSTFSWWGAFLSYTQKPQVFFPTPWFKKTHSPENLTPDDWFPVEAWPGE